MNHLRPWIAALILLMASTPAYSGIINIRGGIGSVFQKDRETRDSTRFGMLHLSTSNRTPSFEMALDLPLRWDADTRDFDRDVWDRSGDWLRPLELLRFRSGSGEFSGGLEVLDGWTPGEGFLVRALTGKGETDYVLPGVRFRWTEDRFDLDVGMDRPVDPTVQAAALTWKVVRSLRLVVEGAVDPEAPLVFSGGSSGGRPSADDSKRLAASAAGFFLDLEDGKVLDIGIGFHTASINSDAKGRGGELSATLDFTDSYLSRLKLVIRSVTCEGGYVPSWFDAVYPVQRWGPQGLPFLSMNPVNGTLPDRNMVSYDISYDLGVSFSIAGVFDGFTDESMRRARFQAKLREENGRGLELSVWSRADGPDIDLFTEEANLQSRMSALYNISPHLLLNVSFEHSWVFRDDEMAFLPLNSLQVGVLYDISL